MKLYNLILFAFLVLSTAACNAQKPITWTPDQLMQPADLASSLTTKTNIPVILSVGPGAIIPNSVDIGMVSDEKNLEKLRAELSHLNKDTSVVIYCGCCPFERCPNIRPALDVLKEMHFTNYHLLNLATNIKTDWISKGYPVTE
ncbi:MAG: rhodanese-like domain-containing protein [Ginsengibacter sp.]